MPAVYFDSDMSDAVRRQNLYNGNIHINSATESSQAIIALAKRMLEEAFSPHDPRTIHKYLAPEEVALVLAELKPHFVHHPECKLLIQRIMGDFNIDTEETYFDVPRLRSAYPSHFLSSGIAYAFHPHRDTWYSAPLCQINWWLPIYPVEPENGMAFYPHYFNTAIANNSEIYNYYEWNTKNRATAAQHIKSDTREQPKPQEVPRGPRVSYLPPPGGIIMFSGAQLHETVPNTTDVARYSIDFRTVHLHDVIAHRGASNIDSRCSGTTMRDYLCGSDFKHIDEEIVRTYDDGTESNHQILYFGDRLTADKPSAST